MANENETISEIAAELRSLTGATGGIIAIQGHVIADRILAAHKQEMSKIASKNGADFGQSGNAEKMREALKFADRELRRATEDDRYGDDLVILVGCMRAVAAACRAALAELPRNCDRMGVDDAFSAFSFMCDNTYCYECPYKSRNRFGDRELCAMLFLYDNGNGGKEQKGGAK